MSLPSPSRRRAVARAVPATALVLIACGGTEPVNPPPPPPPPAVAVSVTPTTASVEAGQTQQVTATVTNTSNTGVTWTSSGGTLAGTGGTVTWTAPSTTGTYSVTATSVADASKSASSSITVTAPNPVRVVLNDLPVAPGGGVLTVTDPESPLLGLSIAVPSGAYPTATRWTVAAVTNVTPTLPTGAEQVGPTIRFTNGQAEYAELPFTITLPARVAADRAVGAFYYDAATDTWDPLPLLGRTDSTITVMTRHVSSDQLIPDAPAASLRRGPFAFGSPAALRAPGSTDVVVVSVSLEMLGGSAASEYRPRLDDWPFENRGSWLTPGGYSFGASTSSVYHFLRRRATGRLFLDDAIQNFNYDNARGIRLASMIQYELFRTSALRDRVVFLIDSAASVGETWEVNQARALALGIWLKRLPRLIFVGPRNHATRSQMMVAFDMNGWKFGVSSTQEPGEGRQITFDGTRWVPFDFGPNKDEPREPFAQVFMVGGSALVPLTKMVRYFEWYDDHSIAEELFPPLDKEYMDPVDPERWRPLPDHPERLVTASESIMVRTLCGSCGFPRPGPGPATRIITAAYTATGVPVGADTDDAAEGVTIELPAIDEIASHGLLHTWPVADNNIGKTIDWSWLDIERVTFTLRAEPSAPQAGQPVTYRLENGGIGDETTYYRWTVGGTVTNTGFGQPYLEQTFDAAINGVQVELIDADGHPLARASVKFGRRWVHVTRGGTVCGITDDRALYCWGANQNGQAGVGHRNATVPVPTRVGGTQEWVQVDGVHVHTCGLTATGEVWCWGDGQNGGAGPDASLPFQTTPVRVPGLPPIKSITVGNWHTCGVANDDSAYCWGPNSDGQLGRGSFSTREFTPQRVAGNLLWKEISASHWFTCGVTTAGGGYCWGTGGRWSSQLAPNAAAPVAVLGPQSLVTISTSDQAICGATLQATGVCWGWASSLPTGPGPSRVESPQVMLTGRNWVSATPGGCALDAEGQAFCWGYGPYSGTGAGAGDQLRSPTPVLGGHRFTQLSRFNAGACGVTTTGRLYCWGSGAGGRHANGSTGFASEPVEVPVPD